jgi:hypothetical protein
MDRGRIIETQQTRTANQAVRVPLRSFLVLVAMALAVLALASSASADKVISEAGEGAGKVQEPKGLAVDFGTGRLYVADSRNHRIDVFDSSGTFAMAFGWGVADGKVQLQNCGPGATPPTTKCLRGLAGGGAGEFRNLVDIAVDNDPSSPSHHDLYVLDEADGLRGARVQKFDSEGHFLLTWGGGVITGGAKGAGDMVSGSTQITNVKTTGKVFEVSQTISGAGIPAETRIVSLGPGTMTLSKQVTTTGTGVALSVAVGPGNVAVNETQEINIENNNPTLEVGELGFRTEDPSPSEAAAAFNNVNQPPASGPGGLQEKLENLSNIGPGNVSVTGPTGGPYTIEFTGPRFADTNVSPLFYRGSAKTSLRTLRNGSGAAEICTAAIAASCSAGVESTGHGEFGRKAHLATGPGGMVYVVDCVGTPELPFDCNNRLQKFDPSGAFVEELPLPLPLSLGGHGLNGVAVDSSGDFYVSVSNELRKYDPAANQIGQLPVAGFGSALAVDAFDNLFSAEVEERAGSGLESAVIAEYDPSGNTLRRFGYGVLNVLEGLAPYQSASGDIYSSEGDSVMERSFPPPGPIVAPRPCKTTFLGNTKATLQAEVNPEGKATTVRFEYIADADFDDNGESFGGAHPATSTPESESIGSDFFLHAATVQADLVPSTEYHCRAVATNADAPAGVTGPEGTFTSKPPLEIGPTSVSGVGTETATLNATVNPLGIPTTGYFEYVEEATYLKDVAETGPGHGFDHATKTPDTEAGEEPIDFGAGESFKAGAAQVSGLKAGTRYRYRIVATDPYFPAGFVGPTKAFRTYLAGGSALPDNRGWELVSPAVKNNADVAVPGNAGGLVEARVLRVQASAGSGEAVTYTSWTPFGEAEGAPGASQYISRRAPTGWTTENISPFGIEESSLVPAYSGFSANLEFGALRVREPALAPACPEGYNNLYLRNNQAGALECLTPEAPGSGAPGSGSSGVCLTYAGVSEDGSRAFFAAPATYADAPAGAGTNLYEWHDGGLRLASILPNGTSAPATPKTSFGAGNTNCQWGESILRHVVSDDGSRAFWTYVPAESGPSQLLARVNGSETLQLDKRTSGAGSGNGVFWAASADGSVVYFTDVNRLIPGSKSEPGKPDLYRYEVGKPSPLTNLTLGPVPGDVGGVVGASDDGSYVYFVAGAILSGEEENHSGRKAVAGQSNLYVYHENVTRFVATLASIDPDVNDWTDQPKSLSARVSPDGLHLAFLSIEAEALAGYDNRVANDTITGGNHCVWNPLTRKFIGTALCPQAFLYDAETEELTCASCSPSGARPLGPTLLPGWTNVFEGPRYLSENGSRLFFETYDALTTADENGKRDVYEFEVPEEGTCTSVNSSFDPASGGCQFLLSGGKSEDESYLVDASANGRDAFISTRNHLVGWDANENFDVYDFREGGGFPEPPPMPPICVGEGCKPPAPPQPEITSPATPEFQGPGNAKPPQTCKKGFQRKGGKCIPKPCKKGFVRKGGKCVKKPKNRNHHKQRNGGASGKRGAGR